MSSLFMVSRSLAWFYGLAFLLAVLWQTPAAYADAIRILPLGDSITVGQFSGTSPDDSGHWISYRLALKNKLVSEGYDVNFVGSQLSGDVEFEDAQHEGHSGWYMSGGAAGWNLLPEVNNFLSANPPKIVLLHIGTNDIIAGHANAAEIGSILDAIKAFSPDLWVILALIVNRADVGSAEYTATTAFNDAVDLIAQQRIQAGDKIIVVDMENGAGMIYGIRPGGDMNDNVHPYATGFQKIAEAWYAGLGQILPRADAGADQEVDAGESVRLDGTGSSDSLGTINAYSWVQTGGSPSVAINNANSARASFVAPSTGAALALAFRLTITDTLGFSHSDTCLVNVNAVPTANAGPDQQVNSGHLVTLDGSNSSDPDGVLVSHAWQQTGGTPSVSLENANSSRATFTAPAVGPGGASFTFRLTVEDNSGATNSDTCTVHLNGPPVADAGRNQQVTANATVTLDGSGSTDADDGIASYTWIQISGDSVSLINPTSARASFIAPAAGPSGSTLVFRISVTDHLGLQSSDDCTVSVTSGDNGSGSGGGGGGGGGCFLEALAFGPGEEMLAPFLFGIRPLALSCLLLFCLRLHPGIRLGRR
jgi:lysophospholipase L1-like esterase